MSVYKPLLVMSNIIVDDIRLADGTHHPHTLGGAALYAAVGASMWWGDVAVVAGVGLDVEQLVGATLTSHAIRRQGLVVRDAHTIRSTLIYRDDGERIETPVYGGEHFARSQLIPADIPPLLRPAAATYIFRDLWPGFWESYHVLQKELGVVFWELQSNAAAPANLARIEELLKEVDIFSLNLTEARSLLGTADPAAIMRHLLEAGGRVVVLRLGSQGALVADGREFMRITPPSSQVVDVTGGGNSFCGAFLAGLCACPGDLEHASRCAAASAALSIGQHGLPQTVDRGQLEALYSTTGVRRHLTAF